MSEANGGNPIEIAAKQIAKDLEEIYANTIVQRERSNDEVCISAIKSIICQHNMGFEDCVDILNVMGTLCDILSPNGAKQLILKIALQYLKKG